MKNDQNSGIKKSVEVVDLHFPEPDEPLVCSQDRPIEWKHFMREIEPFRKKLLRENVEEKYIITETERFVLD